MWPRPWRAIRAATAISWPRMVAPRALAASVLPVPDGGFDIPAFLRDAGTVYMIAEAVSEEAPVAPLFAAMAAEIHYTAAQLGQASEARRLDPPLLMGLDEVTQICPVPLPYWLSDSGGKGIQVVALVHGEAQLAGRWGDHGRQVVLDTSSVKVFLPGITDTTTLQAASTLCGQASRKIRGQDHATRHDVATPDMIRQLPAGFALVIRGGCAPVADGPVAALVAAVLELGVKPADVGAALVPPLVQVGLVVVQERRPPVPDLGEQLSGGGGAVEAADGLLGQAGLPHDRLDALALGAQRLDLLIPLAGADGQGGLLRPPGGRRGCGLLQVSSGLAAGVCSGSGSGAGSSRQPRCRATAFSTCSDRL